MAFGSWSRPIPLDGEEARRFLQQRTQAYLRAVALLTVLLVVVHTNANHLHLYETNPLRELSIAVVVLAISYVAGKRASRSVIELCDALGTFVLVAGFSVALVDRDLATRPELIILLVASNTGAARATLVPSTGARTFVIETACSVPIVVMTALHYGVNAPEGVFSRTSQIAGWCGVIVYMTTIVSRRVHGLSRSVDEARRLGQYTLGKQIGAGGMGEVYRAAHAMLKRPTAVKLLPAARSSETDVKRFEREVQLTSQLTHPSTIQIYDFGRGTDGTFYYAMELLDGLNLDELVSTYGPLSPGRALRILADVCGSLAEAHDAGLVHRDIKPHNIMLCARGGQFDVVKVLDFGLVRAVKPDADASATQAQHVIGTPLYIAPESITAPDQVTASVDLYAVGAVAYFLLTGAPVFSAGAVIEIFAKHLHEAPAPFPAQLNVPAELERLVLACLAKKAADRPASARVLREELLALAATSPTIDLEAWWTQHRTREAPLAKTDDISSTVSLSHTLLPMRDRVTRA